MADETIAIKKRDGGTVNMAATTVDAFKAGLRGALLTASSPAYDEARSIWNGMIDRRPALIARCTGTADVAHALRFAREHGLLFSVRGGGHNIAGLAICDGGLVIDLSQMRGVWVDARAKTARAQAGCLLGDLDRETQAHGLAAVLGFVSATGIAGLTVGGGFGYLTRKYGWTCDNLVSMEVVTADGNIVTASEKENTELFWCLRGGSGNFGIVTSFEYKLYLLGPEILGGAVAWRGEDAAEVLRFYRELTASSPRELTCVAALRIAPPAPWLPKEVHGKPIVAMFVMCSGPIAEAEKIVAPIKAFGKPVADILVRRPYTQMQAMLDATQPKGRRYYWKSEWLSELDPKGLDVIIEQAKSLPSPHSAILLFQVGGVLNELPADHSPMGNRDAAYVVNIAGAWDAAADDAVNVEWARKSWQAVRPFSTGGVYVNFLTDDEGADRVEDAYGKAILERLATLKRKLDPDDVFTHTKRVI